jgi:hypothetical protein
MMLKAMKDEIGETDSDEIKEQFDLDSELKNHQKTKRKELDEITIAHVDCRFNFESNY